VYFVLGLVDELDLSEILIQAQAKDPWEERGFDPRMMTMLPLLAYCVGTVSSRTVERDCNRLDSAANTFILQRFLMRTRRRVS